MDAQLGRDGLDQVLAVDVEVEGQLAAAVLGQRIAHGDRQPAGVVGEPADRHRAPLGGDLGRHPLLDRRVAAIEVGAERGRDAVASGQRLGQLVELEVASLDQVGAEPAAVDDLGGQRLVELLLVDQLQLQKDLAESRHRSRRS